MSQEEKRRVLIVGAGIAGPTLAFWLSKFGIRCTIVERSAELRASGQTVDLRGCGLEVIQRMNIEESLKKCQTKEAGVQFTDEYDGVWADFPSTSDSNSITAELEIPRGDFVKVLYEKTQHQVEYRFGDTIQSVDEQSDCVHVTFESGKEEDYHIVVGADGLGSKTRSFVTNDRSCFIPVGQSVAYFSIPQNQEQPYSTKRGYSRWTFFTGRRSLWVRPRGSELDSVYMCITKELEDIDKTLKSNNIQQQKSFFRSYFSDVSHYGYVQKVLDGMDACDDFYMQKVAQIKLDCWSKGRVVLLGDSAYCPSPISGVGTTLSVVGAYVLAGKIAENIKNDNYKKAFSEYESLMRPYIDYSQKIVNPQLIHPETRYGLHVLYPIFKLVGFINWVGIPSLIMKYFVRHKSEQIDLPNYQF